MNHYQAAARIVGLQTKAAVHSSDPNLDCVAACIGDSGRRIKDVVDAFGGERIDILRWSDDPQVFIRNCLQPAEVVRVIVDTVQGRATVLVAEDQESLARGRRGQNLELASKLCGYQVEIEILDDTGN